MSTASSRSAVAVTAVCAIPVLVRLIFFPDYPGTDDSFIHAAVIENIRAGHGWGINPGEPVNLSTSPLFTLSMLAVSYLIRDVISAGMVLSCAAVTMAVFLTYRISAALSSDRRIQITTALLAAINIHLWRWTGTFIETTFAFTGVLAILYVFRSLYRERSDFIRGQMFFAFGVSVGLLSLLRYECGLLGVAFFLHHVVNDRRFIIRRYAAAATGLFITLAPWVIFAAKAFGSVTPTTLSAKVSPGLILWNAEILREYIVVWGSGVGVALAIIGLTLIALPKRKVCETLKSGVIFLTFPLAVFVFYYLKTPGLQSPARYLLPSMSTLPLLTTVMLSQLRSIKTVLVGAAIQLLASLVLLDLRIAPVLAGMRSGYVEAMTEASANLARYCQEGQTALVEIDIGVISYTNRSKCRIADGGALASPELAGLSISEKIDLVQPRFIIETLGDKKTAIISTDKTLDQIWSTGFRSHSVEMPDRTFTVRLFQVN